MSDGHCGLPTTELKKLSEKLIEVPEALVTTAHEDGSIHLREKPSSL